MTTASEFVKDYPTADRALEAAADLEADIDIDQDWRWDDGTTVLTFDDGSQVIVSGSDVAVGEPVSITLRFNSSAADMMYDDEAGKIDHDAASEEAIDLATKAIELAESKISAAYPNAQVSTRVDWGVNGGPTDTEIRSDYGPFPPRIEDNISINIDNLVTEAFDEVAS